MDSHQLFCQEMAGVKLLVSDRRVSTAHAAPQRGAVGPAGGGAAGLGRVSGLSLDGVGRDAAPVRSAGI
ncbi:hypothetical protein N4G58_13865 [Edwardsiella piscicida]|nr:hypothetical protein N4G58_13865 [Edwardsiella piscicida]